jgi:phosphoglycolate phosphatase
MTLGVFLPMADGLDVTLNGVGAARGEDGELRYSAMVSGDRGCMSDVTVRMLEPVDLAAVAEHLPADPEPSHRDDPGENQRRTVSVLVAWRAGRPIGCGSIRWSGPRAPSVARSRALARVPEIHRLWVHEAERRRGVGSRILAGLEALARGRGVGQIGAGVALANDAARSLCARSGYAEAGIPGYDEVSYRFGGAGQRIEVREPCVFLLKSLTTPALVLFDIDGTLLVSEGGGRRTMLEAGRELFGAGFRFGDVDVRGRLDPHVWRDLARLNGIEGGPASEGEFRARYAALLERRLAASAACVRALDGVGELLTRLEARSEVTLGILSGNYPEAGRLKLAAAKLDPDRFEICAWGSDTASRSELVPIALARYRERTGLALRAFAVSVIGDTPHDVASARAHGCRSLGVATGSHGMEELRRAGADVVVASLAPCEPVERWILASTGRGIGA